MAVVDEGSTALVASLLEERVVAVEDVEEKGDRFIVRELLQITCCVVGVIVGSSFVPPAALSVSSLNFVVVVVEVPVLKNNNFLVH